MIEIFLIAVGAVLGFIVGGCLATMAAERLYNRQLAKMSTMTAAQRVRLAERIDEGHQVIFL